MLKSFPFPAPLSPQKDAGPVVNEVADSTLCWNYLPGAHCVAGPPRQDWHCLLLYRTPRYNQCRLKVPKDGPPQCLACLPVLEEEDGSSIIWAWFFLLMRHSQLHLRGHHCSASPPDPTNCDTVSQLSPVWRCSSPRQCLQGFWKRWVSLLASVPLVEWDLSGSEVPGPLARESCLPHGLRWVP